VLKYVPVFEQRWRKYARPVGRSWRVDETYTKVKPDFDVRRERRCDPSG